MFALVTGFVALEETVLGILEGDLSRVFYALAFVLACLMGLLGYVALCFSAYRRVDSKIALGIGIGLGANFFAMFALHDVNPGALNDWYIVYGPFTVGLTHLVTYGIARHRT